MTKIYMCLKPVACLIVLSWLFAPHVVYSCEKCFGARGDSLASDGTNMAMLTLLIITIFVLSSIGVFFIYISKRIRLLESENVVIIEKGE